MEKGLLWLDATFDWMPFAYAFIWTVAVFSTGKKKKNEIFAWIHDIFCNVCFHFL